MKKKCALFAVLCLAASGFADAGLIQPGDLQYVGAFRLPGPSGGSSWSWSGQGLSYYPLGDSDSCADGFPGSLFGIGHDWDTMVSEISIPLPVLSSGHDIAELNTAETLQEFVDIKPFEPQGAGAVIGDIAWLEAQGVQASGKLYTVWGRHAQFDKVVSHGWAETDLLHPGLAGGWYLGPVSGEPVNHASDDLLCDIPKSWADTYTPGMRLLTGRFREGGLAGQGPSLFAIGPWSQGNPPEADTELDFVTLLRYDDIDGTHTIEGFLEADQWEGVSWPTTTGGNSAVIFIGDNAYGESWYGFPDGTRYDDCLEWPDPCAGLEDRGWYATEIHSEIIFYDPSELGAVALGTMETYEPQPYARLNIDDILFRDHGINEERRVGSCAFDREHGYLYVFEQLADEEDKPLIHVWQVRHVDHPGEDGTPPPPSGPVMPQGAVEDNPPVFRWQGAEGATWYQVWINREGAKYYLQWVQEMQWEPDWEFDAGDYIWWIQSWSPAGYGEWSDGVSFNVAAVPRGEIAGRRPSFGWPATVGATWYRLWIETEGVYYFSVWIPAERHLWWQANWDFEAGSYRWWTQPWSPDGYGEWSQPRSFSISDSSPQTAGGLASYVNGSNLIFYWDLVDGVDWYRIWIMNSDGYYWSQWIYGDNSWQPAWSFDAGSYRWCVQTWNAASPGSFSSAYPFDAP